MATELKIPKRSDLDKASCWSTEDIFPSDAAWAEEFEACQSLPAQAAAFQGRLGEYAQTLLD